MTGAAYEAYIKKWDLDRKEAETYPLTRGVPLEGTPSTPHFKYPIAANNADAALALLPYRPPVRPRYLPIENNQNISLTLKRSLQTGKDRWTQVWLASVHLPGTSQEHPVVVKLFQEALFPRTDWVEFKHYYAWSASASSGREAWGFEQLLPLQGLLLPHSYGFYRFELPCEQIVVGHVMEHIEGHSLERDYAAMIDGTFYSTENRLQREPMLLQIALSVYCIHLCGVHHGDLSDTNLMQLPGQPTFFVFFDLARCTPPSMRHFGKPDKMGLWECLQELEATNNVIAWLEPKLVNKDAWAVDVFTPASFDQIKSSAHMLENRFLSHILWLKEQEENSSSE